MYFKLVITIINIIFFYNINLSAQEIKIKYKINNEIITNIDLEDEKKYLIFINPKLKNLSNKDMEILAKNSIIRDKIKIKELKKVLKIKDNYKFLDELENNLIKKNNFSNKSELVEYLKSKKLKYSQLINKLKFDGLWNQLIYSKFKNSVKIDKLYLRKKLELQILNNKKYEYNLSEILFETSNNENFDKKFSKIKESINMIGFENTANKYSISNTSNKGGKIGWIKETLLSNDIIKIISKIDVGDFSNPLPYPNGYLVLKINEKKEFKQNINIESELKELIRFETNKQLNQFSLLYYKRLKQNSTIDEY